MLQLKSCEIQLLIVGFHEGLRLCELGGGIAPWAHIGSLLPTLLQVASLRRKISEAESTRVAEGDSRRSSSRAANLQAELKSMKAEQVSKAGCGELESSTAEQPGARSLVF